MSGEIVVAPVGLLLLPLAVGAAVGTLAMAGVKAGQAIARDAAARREERLARERERRDREMAELAVKLDALARQEAAAKPRSGSDADFLRKNRESLMRGLGEWQAGAKASLDVSGWVAGNDSHQDGQAPESGRDIKKETAAVYAALSLVDPSLADSCRSNFAESQGECGSFRAELIYDDLKIHYANALASQAKRVWRLKKLEEMKTSLSGTWREKFIELARPFEEDAKALSESAFEKLAASYGGLLEEEYVHKSNELLERQTVLKMKDLGYTQAGRNKSGVVYFNTPDPDYRVMAKVNPANGQLSLRFVRVVASEKEKKGLTAAQRRRDKEKVEQWCKKSHVLLEALEKETGVKLTELYRAEPDDSHEILVVVDKEMAAASSAAATGAGHAAK